jgi:hypothetical protein
MMVTRRCLAIFVMAATILSVARNARAQTAQFKARLTPVPVDTSTAGSITGKGSVAAALTGTTLSLKGTFEGMQSPATLAQLHFGSKGVRGPVEFDLTVTKATSGTVSGTLTLTRVQVDSLKKGWYYIQIHSEKAQDGNLWGWLLP